MEFDVVNLAESELAVDRLGLETLSWSPMGTLTDFSFEPPAFEVGRFDDTLERVGILSSVPGRAEDFVLGLDPTRFRSARFTLAAHGSQRAVADVLVPPGRGGTFAFDIYVVYRADANGPQVTARSQVITYRWIDLDSPSSLPTTVSSTRCDMTNFQWEDIPNGTKTK